MKIYSKLNAENALIFRIVYIDNVPWILDNGMHCSTSKTQATDYRVIGNKDLILKRRSRVVPIQPGGTLADYVPFYFTPFSPMLYNINTGYNGVEKLPNEQVVIFASSLHHLEKIDKPYVISDRHAYLKAAHFCNDRSHLKDLPWQLWQQRDFAKNLNDPSKFERYQAEALIYKHLPVEAFLGLVCYTLKEKSLLMKMVKERALGLSIHSRQGWYVQ